MNLPNWIRKLNRKTSYYKTMQLIDTHREIVKTTGEAADQMIASLDGETGWIDCTYLPKRKNSNKGRGHDNVCTFSRSS